MIKNEVTVFCGKINVFTDLFYLNEKNRIKANRIDTSATETNLQFPTFDTSLESLARLLFPVKFSLQMKVPSLSYELFSTYLWT
jgi:hypothetical protein